MITDSIPWKQELEKVADRLERRKTQKRWTDRTSFLVERDIMVSAYALRKLHEAHKISDSLAAQRVHVTRHRLAGQVPDVMERYFYWEHYDLGSGTDVTQSLPEFSNQIIHSWIWGLSASESENLLDGIYVASDWKRRQELYFIAVDTLIDLFRAVGSEYVVSHSWARDKDGDFQTTQVLTDDEVEAAKGLGAHR